MPTLNNTLRNTAVAVYQATFGGGTAELLSAANAVLASIALPPTAFGAPVNGAASLSGAWTGTGTAAAGAGVACTQLRLVAASGETLTLSAGASGAEAIISNNIDGVAGDVIIEGNTVTVTACTLTQPSN